MVKIDNDETCELLSKLIQNKAVNPPGNELLSIRTIEKFLRDKNVPCEVVESTSNRGNLIARIKGSDDSTPSLIFGPSHVDVVPVPDPTVWDIDDPFGGEKHDGYIWGRGALDMLYIVVSQVQAFAKLFNEDFKPKGDLILLIVCDEETGGVYGTEYMLKNHGHYFKGGDCAVTESGGVSMAPNRLMILNGEKGSNWKYIEFKGTPGHGSMPFGSDNAVVKASKAIQRIEKYCNNKIPITTEFVTNLANGIDLGLISKIMITNKLLLPFALKSLKKRDPQMAKVIHGLTRMTLSPNMVNGGSKVNQIAGNCKITVDIRTLPGQDEDYVIKHLKKAMGDLSPEANIYSPSKEEGGLLSYGNQSPVNNTFVNTLESVIQKVFEPSAKIVPFLMPAVSDARFFREKGINTYGFSIFDPNTPTSHLTDLIHGPNERVSVKTIELSTLGYYWLAKEFIG